MFTSAFAISVTLAVALSYLSVAVIAIPLTSRSMDASADTKIAANLCRIANIVYDDPVASVASFDRGNLTNPNDDISPALFRQLLQSCCNARSPSNLIDDATAVGSKAASISLPNKNHVLLSASTSPTLTIVSKMLMATPSSSPHSFSASQGVPSSIGALATVPTLASGANNRLSYDTVKDLVFADATSSTTSDESSIDTTSHRVRPIELQSSKGHIVDALDSTNNKEDSNAAHATISLGLSHPSPSSFASSLSSNRLLSDSADKGGKDKPELFVELAKIPSGSGSGSDGSSSQTPSPSAKPDASSRPTTSKPGSSFASSPASSSSSGARTATSTSSQFASPSAKLSALALPSIPVMTFENLDKPSMTASTVPLLHHTRVEYKAPTSTGASSQSASEPCECEDETESHVSAHGL